MATETLIRETEYREANLMEVIRRLMIEGKTGQCVLNIAQGRVYSVIMREKVSESNGNGNGHNGPRDGGGNGHAGGPAGRG